MSSVISIQKSEKANLSNSQKTFNRLKKKIESLQNDLRQLTQELDRCHHFFLERIHPKKEIILIRTQEFVMRMYRFYKEVNQLTKKDRDTLKKLILEKAEIILKSAAYVKTDPAIGAIFEDLTGKPYVSAAENSINRLKEEMEEYFGEMGMDIDLSNIDSTDDEFDIKRKIMEAMASAGIEQEESSEHKPKSKKEIQKEKKAKELEEVQKKGLGGIFKQLAKAFHPDLEQDPAKKIEKEQLMKRLTCAYESNDLHALISLEIEWISRSDEQKKNKTDEQLNIYNSILKDQIEELETDMQMTLFHPKYHPIHAYISESPHLGMPKLMRMDQELASDVKSFQHLLVQLKGKNGEHIIRDIIQDYARVRRS